MINRQDHFGNFQPQSYLLMKISYQPMLGLQLALAFGIRSCTPVEPVSEAEYNATIVGNWLGTGGDIKESMTFSADGSFIAQLRPRGYISNTLSEGVTGIIRGTWAINGKNITLKITSAEDELIKNSVTSSTILSFSQGELTMKNDRGETSIFQRVASL